MGSRSVLVFNPSSAKCLPTRVAWKFGGSAVVLVIWPQFKTTTSVPNFFRVCVITAIPQNVSIELTPYCITATIYQRLQFPGNVSALGFRLKKTFYQRSAVYRRLLYVKSDIESQASSRWFGVEIWDGEEY
ncbi:hypothetical protein AVEN_241987-1 [Araneus ventricosus]|uniref:Uncharacterized protein n=1 Tax=Araneus ventricosus TaxID=182803 RepID=A0A4Y2ECZ3_ARAVE|nr:hypothetical protein AVEN_241987-1 [Araneus ventricosus]